MSRQSSGLFLNSSRNFLSEVYSKKVKSGMYLEILKIRINWLLRAWCCHCISKVSKHHKVIFSNTFRSEIGHFVHLLWKLHSWWYLYTNLHHSFKFTASNIPTPDFNFPLEIEHSLKILSGTTNIIWDPKGPSVQDVANFKDFMTPNPPPPPPSAFFYYYLLANLANFWPLPPKKMTTSSMDGP